MTLQISIILKFKPKKGSPNPKILSNAPQRKRDQHAKHNIHYKPQNNGEIKDQINDSLTPECKFEDKLQNPIQHAELSPLRSFSVNQVSSLKILNMSISSN